MKPLDVVIALVVPLLWSTTMIAGKPAVTHFPPLMLMAMVYGMTAVTLAPRQRLVRTPWLLLAGIAVLTGSVNNGFIFTGLQYLPASTAVLLIQAQVPFTVLVASISGMERLAPLRVLGIGCALAGVVVVVGWPEQVQERWAAALVLSGGLFWAVAQTLVRRYARDAGPVFTSGLALCAAPQCLLLSLLIEDGQVAALAGAGLPQWGAVAVMSLAGFSLGQSLWYRLLGRYRVDQVSPFVLLMPAYGLVLGALVLGEAISTRQLLGGGVIVVGLALVLLSRGAATPAAPRTPREP